MEPWRKADSDKTEEEEEEEKISGKLCELVYTPPRVYDLQQYQKPNDVKSTGDWVKNEATEVEGRRRVANLSFRSEQ